MNNESNSQQNNDDLVAPIRTFQSDIADALKNQKGSVIKIAVLEQEKKEKVALSNKKTKSKNTFYITFGIILLLVSLLVSFYFFYLNQNKQTLNIQTLIPKTFVKGDHQTTLSVSNESLVGGELNEIIDKLNIPVGQIEQINILKKIDGVDSFMKLDELFSGLSINTPEIFMFSLDKDVYLLGVYQTDIKSPFLLMKTKVFSNTFSSTLDWESKMVDDLRPFIKSQNEEGSQVLFKDVVIKNEDVRVGFDKEEKEVIAYSFFGHKKEYLLIAPNSDVIGSLISRFTKKLLEQ
jgi:hypothetical protein